MIPTTIFSRLRTKIKKAQRPLLLFDDDCDGVCAYLILKTINSNAIPIIVDGNAIVDQRHIPYVALHNPDLIVILDVADIHQEFLKEVQVPIIWLDHHSLHKPKKKVTLCSPLKYDPEDRFSYSTATMSYAIAQEKWWLAITGTIADWILPKEIKKIQKAFPGLLEKTASAPQALFESQFGKLVFIIDFNLKKSGMHQMQIIQRVEEVKHPQEILQQTTDTGRYLYERVQEYFEEYEALVESARKEYKAQDPLVVFSIDKSTISFTREVANRLIYDFPEKVIVITRKRADDLRISVRSNETTDIDLPKMLEEIFKEISGNGGGHKNACGCTIKVRDRERFLEQVRSYCTENTKLKNNKKKKKR